VINKNVAYAHMKQSGRMINFPKSASGIAVPC